MELSPIVQLTIIITALVAHGVGIIFSIHKRNKELSKELENRLTRIETSSEFSKELEQRLTRLETIIDNMKHFD